MTGAESVATRRPGPDRQQGGARVGGRPRGWLARRPASARQAHLIVLIVVLFIAMSIYRPRFAAADNIQFLLLESVVVGLLAIGQTFVILARGIDLAVAPVMGLTACVTGLMAMNDGLAVVPAIALGVGLGVLLGAVNGVLVALLRIPPIITTLGTLGIFGGLQFMYTNGQQVSFVPDDFRQFGQGRVLSILPVPVLLLGAVTALAWAVLRWTRFGRGVMAVGNNASSARAAGVRVRLVTGLTYVISGCLAGLSGVIYVAHTAAATAVTGTADNLHLQSIAAVLIGGTLISGGRGGVVGSVLGALFLTITLTSLVFLGVPAIWNMAGQGLLILAALGLNRRGASRPFTRGPAR